MWFGLSGLTVTARRGRDSATAWWWVVVLLEDDGPFAAFFAAGVVDEVGDAFDVVDAGHDELAIGDVGGDQRDRADIEHAVHQPLHEGHVFNVDEQNAVVNPAEDALFVHEPLAGELVGYPPPQLQELGYQHQPDD